MPAVGARSAMWALAARHRVVDERDEQGALEIFLPKPGVLITRASGRLSGQMAHAWIGAIDPMFRRGMVMTTFHDWDEMESYDSSARRLLTGWLLANTKMVSRAEFLVSSKIVSMGLSAANLATTLAGLSMTSHTVRAEFEQAVMRAL